jgi:CHAD domain-containing protein
MSTKWVENCDPNAFVGPFALRVLHERMEMVEAYLALAATHSEEDTEFVHQLRVGCRRAMAALRAFLPLFKFPPKKLVKWLKRIREAAGPARDIDVLLKRFSEAEQDDVAAYAIRRFEKDRITAQSHLSKIAKKTKQFRECCDKSLALGFHGTEPTVQEHGLKAVEAAYYPFTQIADLKDHTPQELHQLRIAGKRLRYSLEIFHGIFPDDMREEIYPQIVELQERLGAINDHATAQALYQSWLGEMPADGLAASVAERVAKEHKSLQRRRAKFLDWWSAERQEQIETYFQQYLGL